MGNRMYRATLGDRANDTSGHATIVWFGTLTDCGQWVEGESCRWRRDDSWHWSEEAALAALAPQIEAIALACNRQARRLRLEADEVRQGATT
jgi:hypothetical protein